MNTVITLNDTLTGKEIHVSHPVTGKEVGDVIAYFFKHARELRLESFEIKINCFTQN